MASEKVVDIFEGKILRKILGPVHERVRRRIRYNSVLYDVFDDPDVSIIINVNKLQWADHVERMSEERISKSTLKRKTEGKRPVRKPRKRWEGSIDEIFKNINGG